MVNKNQLLKNPVLRNKLTMALNHPAGDLLNEIQEQDLTSQVGGADVAVVAPITPAVSVVACPTVVFTPTLSIGACINIK